MPDELEERLWASHRSFEGLLSLLPPDLYYGKEGTENEWMKKKQTKEEKKAARKAKLNPANHKTALDVANERDRKRRLEDEEADRAAEGIDGPIERPGEGIKNPKAKKQKLATGDDVHTADKLSDDKAAREEKRKARELKKKEKRKAKNEREKQIKPAKKAKKQEKKAKLAGETQKKDPEQGHDQEGDEKGSKDEDEEDSESEAGQNEDDFVKLADAQAEASDQESDYEEDEAEADSEDEASSPAAHPGDDMEAIDMSGLVDDAEQDRESTSRSESPAPEFSPHHNDRSSSSSSIPAPAEVEELRQEVKQKKRKSSPDFKKPALKVSSKPIADPKHETQEQIAARKEAQIEKLRALIEAKRAARNADGLNGKPARSRSELIEARRLAEQKKKEKKKELRANEKEQLKKAEAEAQLASLRGSPSLASDFFTPRSRSASLSVSSPGVAANNFSFGRVAFTDGARMNSTLSGLASQDKPKKGPQDAKTALLAAEKHQARLNSLDENKRSELEEKDVWLNARRKIAGEKVKDDVGLLKKSLKRKEKMKGKSEREWKERKEGVVKSQEARQRNREENLRKRREEKKGGGGGSSSGKKKVKGAGVKKKSKK